MQNAGAKFEVGQWVVASDLRSVEADRRPDRCQGLGVVKALPDPQGRYLVEMMDNCTGWYDEDEMKKVVR